MTLDPFRAPPEQDPLKTLPEDAFNRLARRFAAVRRLQQLTHRTYADVEDEAEAAEVSPATLYRDLAKLEGRGELRQLIPNKGGFPKGRSRLHPIQEMIIEAGLRGEYLKLSKPSLKSVWEAINRANEAAGTPPVSRATVIRRLARIRKQEVLRRRGGARRPRR